MGPATCIDGHLLDDQEPTSKAAFDDGIFYVFARDSLVLKGCIACVKALLWCADMHLGLHLSAVDSVLCVAMTVRKSNT